MKFIVNGKTYIRLGSLLCKGLTKPVIFSWFGRMISLTRTLKRLAFIWKLQWWILDNKLTL